MNALIGAASPRALYLEADRLDGIYSSRRRQGTPLDECVRYLDAAERFREQARDLMVAGIAYTLPPRG